MAEQEPYVTIDDLATHFAISISTVRKWIREKDIPENTYIKVGNTYRFRLSAVERALANDENDTQMELNFDASGPVKLY